MTCNLTFFTTKVSFVKLNSSSALIQKLLEITNQLENKCTVFALDALRNLFVQAYILDLPRYATGILGLGLIQTIETLVDKAVN